MTKLIGLSNMAAPPDSLHALDNLIVEKLKKWDVFDFEISMHQFESIKKIITNRKLKWTHMEGGSEPFVYDGIVTIVIGKPDGDFEDHEVKR